MKCVYVYICMYVTVYVLFLTRLLSSAYIVARISLMGDVYTHECKPDMDTRSKNESKYWRY